VELDKDGNRVVAQSTVVPEEPEPLPQPEPVDGKKKKKKAKVHNKANS
jgi:hypothetical protein